MWEASTRASGTPGLCLIGCSVSTASIRFPLALAIARLVHIGARARPNRRWSRMGPLTAAQRASTLPCMSGCAICRRPVVVDPVTLSDGRLVHAACKQHLTHEIPRPRSGDDHPQSATRIKAAPRRRSRSGGGTG
jgi:hypothetical protein